MDLCWSFLLVTGWPCPVLLDIHCNGHLWATLPIGCHPLLEYTLVVFPDVQLLDGVSLDLHLRYPFVGEVHLLDGKSKPRTLFLITMVMVALQLLSDIHLLIPTYMMVKVASTHFIFDVHMVMIASTFTCLIVRPYQLNFDVLFHESNFCQFNWWAWFLTVHLHTVAEHKAGR